MKKEPSGIQNLSEDPVCQKVEVLRKNTSIYSCFISRLLFFFSVIKCCLTIKSRIFKDRKIKSREKNLRIPLHAGQLS